MLTKKDLEDVVVAINQVFDGMDKRIAELEKKVAEAAEKPSTTASKKSKEKA